MGAYLSEPMTNKETEDGSGNDLRYGASCMQGWRASQEDAHTCMAVFDEKSSLYGVYDGHGGAEVAIYVAQHFPELLKSIESYSKEDMENALIQAYLKMDARIKEPEALAEIQKIAKIQNGEKEGDSEAVADYEEENVSELYEEATMPLDKLVAKYQKQSPSVGSSDSKEESNEEKPCSSKKVIEASSSSSFPNTTPLLKSEASSHGEVNNGDDKTDIHSAMKIEDQSPSSDGNTAVVVSSSSNVKIIQQESSSCKKLGDSSSASKADSSHEVKDSISAQIGSNLIDNETEIMSKNGVEELQQQSKCNGNGLQSTKIASEEDISSSTAIDSASLSKKDSDSNAVTDDASVSTTAVTPTKPRKGKVHPVPVIISQAEIKKPIRESAQRAIQAFADSDSDFDSSDSDVKGEEVDSDDDDSEDDDEEGEEEDSDDSDELEDDSFLNDMQEPGYDSGCTAVVALLKWEGSKLNLWVANAGDSRCVVSRNGEALEMSYDHKPESEVETLRIIRAGGKVTDDGRVNGGLNLSRALGDHSYKQNTTLPAEEQMISPLPSVQHAELDPQNDDFIVLACDGVWNSMSSQQVVDFVSQRINTAPSLSSICGELFDACLSEDTHGDGTGCDNMTAIIIQLPKQENGTKRPREETENNTEEPSKRPKLTNSE